MAHDLVGKIPGWTQEGYDHCRFNFERAFGQLLHPDDKPLPGIHYRS
ncbi:hypothetical protein GS504_00940 [Rhodococcus hoagii]|nr:hypothetical protein [Prescottella equi]